MVEALAEGLDEKLSSSVSRIEWSGRGSRGQGGVGGVGEDSAAGEKGSGRAAQGGKGAGGGRDGMGGDGRKMGREEEEDTLVAEKEESALCVGSFVSKSGVTGGGASSGRGDKAKGNDGMTFEFVRD